LALLTLAILPVAAPLDTAVVAQQPPRTVRRPARPVDRKKEARKVPSLTATVAWQAALPAPPAAAPSVDASQAYFWLRDGSLVALALADGSTVWTVPVAGVAAPATGDQLVYVPLEGAIQALDAATGAARWSVALSGPLAAPLRWWDGRLLAATADGHMRVLHSTSGTLLWDVDLRAVPVHVAATVTGDRVYASLGDGRVLALWTRNGERIWESRLPAAPTMLFPSDDRVFAGAADHFLYCLDVASGKRHWRWKTGAAVVGTAVVDRDNVYFVSLDNVLRALNRAHGSQQWKTELPSRPLSGPFLVGGLLLVQGQSSELPAYQLVDGSEAGVAKLAGEAVPPMRILPGIEGRPWRLLAATGEGEVQMLEPGLAPLQWKRLGNPSILAPYPVIEPGTLGG
jgi:outer membrane protein assembly factor BamB